MASNRLRGCAGSGTRTGEVNYGVGEALEFNHTICVVVWENPLDAGMAENPFSFSANNIYDKIYPPKCCRIFFWLRCNLALPNSSETHQAFYKGLKPS